jgi:DNA-binding beta-propeller fold protein YncE
MTSAKFYYPSGVAVDTAGTVYVSSGNGNTIRMIAAGELSLDLCFTTYFYDAGSAQIQVTYTPSQDRQVLVLLMESEQPPNSILHIT